ncbi:MAG: CRISPR system precrRNA processing endoribonuclease RAMP protein Cas6 [Candidatus Wallbacteria bacterium]
MLKKFYKYLENFTLARIKFELAAIDAIKFNDFTGSALRGIFGRALKLIACGDINNDCQSCIHAETCCYQYSFETKRVLNSEIMKKYPNVPHPFVIIPPTGNTIIKPNDLFKLEMVLIGNGINYISHYIQAIIKMGELGIGSKFSKFLLEKAYSISYGGRQKNIYSYGSEDLSHGIYMINFKEKIINESAKIQKFENLKINYITPTRIQYNESIAQKIDFHILVRNTLRRLTHLNYFHINNETPDNINFKDIISDSESIKTINFNFKQFNVTRFSSRQDRKHDFNGITGAATYRGEKLYEFYPLIKLCEYVNVGKSTSFGMGSIALEHVQ